MKWSEFIKKYPNYNKYRFSNDDGNVKFLFNGVDYNPFNTDGSLTKVLYQFPVYEGHHYKPEDIRDFLGMYEKQPDRYLLNLKAQYKITPWDENPEKLNYYSFDVYITPQNKTHFTFRNIFSDSKTVFRHTAEAKRWLASPNLSYFAQALNFSMFCATAGCGVTREMLDDTQVGSFYKFHIYFTIRRILRRLQTPLPNDKLYSWNNNFYNKTAFQKLRVEFNTGDDFRFLGPINKGLGYTYSYGYHGISKSNDKYVPYKSSDQLHDEWNKDNDDQHMGHFEIEYLTDERTQYQYEWFFPKDSQGLTKAGLARINQSIEAYVYCVLGSQAQSRSSIIGNSASAQETKQIFLTLFESAIVENDISKSIQRYQFALQQAKQQLNLAVATSCWLMPSNLIINNTIVQGYNNKLQKATDDVKIGINMNINNEMIQIKKHNLGPSKTKLPHQNKPDTDIPDTNNIIPDKPVIKPIKQSQTHDNNLTIITICSAAIAWYLFR